MKLRLVERTYTEGDINAMKEVLNSDRFTMGKKVEEFERAFCEKFNFNYCVMVNSGSSANLLAMSVLSNEHRMKYLKKGDRVLVPSVCWSTSVYPIIQNGLIPVFMDINPKTLNIDAEEINKYENISGIVLVHILGNSANMEKVMKIVKEKDLIVFEDTCESLSSTYNDEYLGGFGDMGSFSFYFSHHMTTVEGGMVTCKTKEDYDLLRCLRAHGWSRYSDKTYEGVNNKFCFINIGYNFRPMEIQAAMGLNQLLDLDKRNKIRKKNYNNITKRIYTDRRNYNIFELTEKTEGCNAMWFAIVLILNDEYESEMKNYVEYLDKNGIENRPVVTGNFTRQPVMKMINENINPEVYKGAEKIHRCGLYIGCPTNEVYSDEKIEEIVDILYSFEKFNFKIPFYHSPHKIEKSLPYVEDAIKSTWIAESGKYVNKCCEELKKLTNTKYTLLTSCGTSALHCLIKALKFKYPECKKIYIPNNTYIACINMLLHEFSMNMIECLDVDIDTLNIEDVSKLEKNSALFVIHNIGGITNIPKIKRERPDLIILEDNAEGFLGKYEGIPTGGHSLASSISFHMNKNITAGQGGAFCTNDKEVFEHISCYVKYGLTNERFKYKMIGNNYKMSNVLAAILLSQIEQIDEILNDKKIIYNLYKEELKDHPKIKFQVIKEDVCNSYWNMVIRLVGNTSYKELEEKLKIHNIEARPMFYPLQTFEYLKDLKVPANTNSLQINNEYVFVPINKVKKHNIKYICQVLKKLV
jgi:CDP-6-deoxy-D-xylo-4-hexulose-3-dehydrase